MPPLSAPLRYLLTLLGVALAYAAVGWAGLQFVNPSGFASPIYPAAGFALVMVLRRGYRIAPGVALGAFLINVLLIQQRGGAAVLSPALIGLGAMLQAMAGTWLTRRFVSQPLLLSEPRDVAWFYLLAGGLACCVSASIGVLSLIATGEIPAATWASTGIRWWIGDTTGVLIAAPIVLCFFGRPRSAWRKRRLSLAMPMLIATLLLGAATRVLGDWDEQRRMASFERDADNAAHAVEAVLRKPLMALEAAEGLLTVAPQLSRDAFARSTASQFAPGSQLLAMGLALRVPRTQLASFNRAAQEEGFEGFQARDRGHSDDPLPAADEDMLSIRLIEPLARNQAALGVNLLSIAAPRAAVERARASGRATATTGFQLTQDREEAIGVVVYQAIYKGQAHNMAERLAALRGAVFVTLRPDEMLRAVSHHIGNALALCLVDADPQARPQRLAGPLGCEQATQGFKTRSIDFAGRAWDIRIFEPRQDLRVRDARGWPFALIGLLCCALLGALLLLVTGRTHRIEAVVLERTAELKREAAERERSSVALRDSQQRFRNIFDAAPIGVIFAELSGKLQEVNPYICHLLGYSADELLSMRISDFSHPDDRVEDLSLFQMLLRGEVDSYVRHKRYITRSGQELAVRSRVVMLRDERGHPNCTVGVVEDITEQMRLQELEQARQSAVAANEAKSEFLSRMSHELRTPLNAMLGFSQLLELDRDPPLSAGQRARVAQIQQAGWHLLEMINETLDLSRIEAGGIRLNSEALDLAPLVTEVLSMLDGEAHKRRIQLQQMLGLNARWVHGDGTRIKQVLINLLSNAVKYNRDGGAVEISSQLNERGMVEIRVRDSGLGLSPDQLAQMFQPFNRLGQEQGNIEGTGIGLVISKRLAELMGGSLHAQSSPALGSTFVLTLPSARAAAEAAAPATMNSKVHYGRKRRVIYIEDNPVNATLMQGILAQRPDIALEIYATATEGLAAIHRHQPDLLLLDMQLPDLDGLSVLRRLRAAPLTATLPILMVTANAMQEQNEACRLAGAQDYLTKPIDIPRLLALVDTLLA
jgi:PAS domain S-box-containing protein